jgi:hypothetical protein
MSNITQYTTTVTTTGSAGSATGSATTEALTGYLVDVYLDFNASLPATADTTIAYANQGGNILVVTNSATDALIAPRQKYVDNTNTAITNSFGKFLINGPLTISIAQGDALTPALTVTFRLESA